MLRIQIKASDVLSRKIEALILARDGFASQVSLVVREAAFSVTANAKALVPISTGALRRSIQPTILSGGLAAIVGSFLPYAARQEFDANLDHSVRSPRVRIRNTIAGRIGTIIKGTGQTNPAATWGFLRKSLAKERPRFLSGLEGLVNRFGQAWKA